MILLDTQVLLWFFDGDDRLGDKSREITEAALVAGDAAISAMTAWEIAMLASRRRIALAMPPVQWLDQAVNQGLQVLGVDRRIAFEAGTMPREVHGDPCDRIIMATARSLDCPLVTSDRLLLDYGKEGWLRTIDARH